MSGGLFYGNHEVAVLIGTKSGTTRTGTALTGTLTDTTKTFATGGFSKLNLDILYTQGAAETNNAVNIVLEASPDGVNFYQLTNEAATTTTSTLYQRTFVFTAASVLANSFTLGIDIFYKNMRVSVSETGVAANVGNVYIEATLSGR